MLENKEGHDVPQATFHIIKNGQWTTRTSDDLFKGKNVILFALPGAFTPTCSSTHLPRYNDLAATFKAQGIDDIICLSVNDTFVMNEWAKDQEAENITIIPDGNGEFSEKMGLLVNKENLGFGKRSWRYSMLVRDGKIEKMFIEPEVEGDPFEVSDADTMLGYLAPQAAAPEYIALFTRAGCPHCARAKKLLNDRGLSFEEIQTSNHGTTSRAIRAVCGQQTVPQVFIGGKHIGGADELETHLANA